MMLLAAALLAPLQAGRQPAPDYSKPASWLCLPGRADICSTPLKTTALNPNGYGSTGLSPVAKDAGVDCFYVYPTVSRDRHEQRPDRRARKGARSKPVRPLSPASAGLRAAVPVR
jgi:hypothetical protein